MSLSAQTVAELMAAGLEGDALVAALRRIEEASHVTSQTSPGALRTRKWRASQNVTVTSQGVTSDDPTYKDSNSKEEKKERDVGTRHRTRRSYTPTFETFWKTYPTDKLMSKLEASVAFEKMSEEDQLAAIAAIPAFKAETAKLGGDHRIIHAVNYLKKRRFDGFADTPDRPPLNLDAYTVAYGSEEWWAWDADCKGKGKRMPNPVNGHWTFPSRYPQALVEPHGTSEIAA